MNGKSVVEVSLQSLLLDNGLIVTDVFIGDAASIWKDTILQEVSRCLCTPETGCDENCLNRYMFYECDDTNCSNGAVCSNRSFGALKKRCKKGGKYDIGVEVMKTPQKGYGVRSNRSFDPGQIIVEYAGEIITQDECDTRMEELYKDNEVWYFYSLPD
jgi:histone-lysine N-methyltransferase ASH1L